MPQVKLIIILYTLPLDYSKDIFYIIIRNESDHNGQTQFTSRPQLVAAVTMVTAGNEVKKLSHPGTAGTRELISWLYY